MEVWEIKKALSPSYNSKPKAHKLSEAQCAFKFASYTLLLSALFCTVGNCWWFVSHSCDLCQPTKQCLRCDMETKMLSAAVEPSVVCWAMPLKGPCKSVPFSLPHGDVAREWYRWHSDDKWVWSGCVLQTAQTSHCNLDFIALAPHIS